MACFENVLAKNLLWVPIQTGKRSRHSGRWWRPTGKSGVGQKNIAQRYGYAQRALPHGLTRLERLEAELFENGVHDGLDSVVRSNTSIVTRVVREHVLRTIQGGRDRCGNRSPPCSYRLIGCRDRVRDSRPASGLTGIRSKDREFPR